MTDEKKPETTDEKDLYENLTEEEMYELIQEEKEKKPLQKEDDKPKRPFPKWVFWLIALFMVINIGAALPSIFSLPALEFLKTSAQLLNDDDIKEYKESIVVVDTGSGRGTGFSISPEGYIITNYHVVDEYERLWLYFPEHGPLDAEIIATYPEYDLAVLDAEGENYPYLELADQASFETNESFYFIGNPLRFSGIANKGNIIDYTSSSLESDALMLDAPIYKGNSGSPVINENGEVIGVIYATRQDDEHGKVGLAVPIERFHEKFNQDLNLEEE
ncbi:serine protease [Halalkalibacillus sediminis]|uniref:Serine protease n=1 Tax=Halalkalibacillus sediminis TaxID=2018042 RepID=A0A2I0QV89_9BACI|nr:serine protease [Halalkalibacillus sediminis]PKR78238.1 serine protease [Halalkalibacillus sediminis]